MELLAQGHSGEARKAQDLAGAARNAAPAAETGGGRLHCQGPQPLGGEDANTGAQVAVAAHGPQDQAAENCPNGEGPPPRLEADKVFLPGTAPNIAVAVE